MRQHARINVKALVVLLVVVGLVGGGVIVGHYVRKRSMADAALEKGRAALNQKAWAEACKHLRVYLSSYPNDEGTLYDYAEANLKVRPRETTNVLAAIAGYRRLLRDHRPGDQSICQQLTKLYLRIRDYGEAEYVCRQWLKAHPQDQDATVHLAKTLAAQRKFDEAGTRLRALLDTVEKPEVEAYRLLSVIAVHTEAEAGWPKAIQWLDQCVKEHPRSPKAHALRAHLYRNASPPDESAARADLLTAEELNPDDPLVLVVLSEEWMEWGELDRAGEALKRLEQVTPQTLVKYDVLPQDIALARYTWAGKLGLRRGDNAGLAELADEGLANLTGNRRDLFLSVAVKLYLAGERCQDAAGVLEQYQEVLDRPGGGGSAGERFLVLKARVLAAQEKPDEVIRVLKTTVARGADDPAAQSILAWAYEATGQTAKARNLLVQYTQRVPGDPLALLRLARAYRHSDWQRVLVNAVASEKLEPTLEAKLLRIEAQIRLSEPRPSGSGLEQERVLRESVDQLTLLRDGHPEEVGIRLLLVAVSFMQGDVDEAIRQARQAIDECSDPLPAEMKLIDLYVRSDRSDEAMKLCEQAVSRHGDVAAPWLRLADLQTGKRPPRGADATKSALTDEAYHTLSRAVESLTGTERDTVEDAMVRHLLASGQREEAASLMSELARQRPGDVEIRQLLLSVPEVRQDSAKAQAIVDEMKAIEEQPAGGGADDCRRWRVAQALLWLEDLKDHELAKRQEELAGMLAPCTGTDPAWDKPAIGLGLLYERLGRLDRAEEVYRRALAQKPRAFRIADRLLRVLERQEKYVEADEILGQLPKNLGMLAPHRLEIALGRGAIDEAIDEIQQRVAADPQDAEARIMLARLLYSRDQDLDRAFGLLDEAATIAPDALAIASTRIAILRAAGMEDECITLIDAEVARRNDFPAYMLRARYYESVGDLSRAEADYKHLTTFAGHASAGYALWGQCCFRHNRIDEAIAAFEAAVEADPENHAVRRALMHLLVAAPEPKLKKKGLALLADLRRESPNDPSLLRIEAEVFLADGSKTSQEAAAMLDQVIQMNPRDALAWRERIKLAHDQGDLQGAKALVLRALAAHPADESLLLAQANLESELGNTSVAREIGLSVANDHPQNLEARILLVQLFLRQGDVATAARMADEATGLAPKSETVQMARSTVLLAQGKLDLAIENLESYIDEEGGARAVDALLMLAKLHLRQRDYVRAGKRLTQAADVDPEHPGVALARLKWHALQGEFEQVSSIASARLASYRDRESVLLSAAYLLMSAGTNARLQEARGLFEKIIELNPNSAEGYCGIAQVAISSGDTAEAARAYRKVLKLEPYNELALNDLAWFLAEEGDADALEEAYDLATRGIERHPENPHLRDTRAIVLIKQGKPANARRDLEQCLRLPGVNPATRSHATLCLAKVLAAMGESAEARARLEEARQLDQQYSVYKEEERAEIARLLDSLR